MTSAMTSSMDSDSLLVIDVGSVSTRAILFDVVEGKYRYLASGVVPTTAGAPYHNVSEGVRMALDQLSKVTGRILVDAGEQLIIPSAPDGSGVDKFAAMVSAGPPIKVVAVGLLEDVSLESALHLAKAVYTEIGQTISLNDRRKTDDRINAILKLRPDLIVVAGGTENGASQSVMRLLEAIGLACYLLPQEKRPDVLFAGNQVLEEQVKDHLSGVAELRIAPNIRPNLEHEQLDAAQSQLASIYAQVRSRQIPGVDELNAWANGGLMPNSLAMGRVVRYLSNIHTAKRGVLGVDIGSSATSVAAAFAGELTVGVYPQYGLGQGVQRVFEHIPIAEVSRWLTKEIPEEHLREYVYNKSLYPQSLPVTKEEMEIEHALARCAIRYAVQDTSKRFPAKIHTSGSNLLPWVDPILATGSVLTQAPSLAHSAMILLDGLQPTGVSSMVLDQNHIVAALGAAASVAPMLTVQVLDSNAFVYMGTVISPVGKARPGTSVLRLKLTYESGHETNLDVNYGSFEVLPLPPGQTADLQLQPLHKFDVGMGAPGRGGILRRVMGGVLGVIIDARGRPLQPARDLQKRAESFNKWLWTLGGK